jgi:membrane fusion protein, multidrug efflux system
MKSDSIIYSANYMKLKLSAAALKQAALCSLLIFAASCSEPPKDKKGELADLKKEQERIQKRIKELEKEISLYPDSTRKTSGKTVEVQRLEKEPFVHYIEVQGKVDAEENISVSAEMSGIVSRILVKEGQQVSTGQVLAELDNKVITQSIAELQSSLDFASSMYLKQKNLWEQKIGTEIQYLTAKNQKESLEGKMATLKEQLSMTRIKSPINGTVDAIDIKIGQAVMPGIPAIRVVNFSNLKIRAEIAESYYNSVKKGSSVVVKFPGSTDSVVTRIDYATKVINPLNRTFTVEVKLPEGREYHPNMSATLRINDYTSREGTVSVPVSIVQNSEEGRFVYTVENGRVKKAIVTVGRIYNGSAEIESGLSEGDSVITKGHQDVNEGEVIASNE